MRKTAASVSVLSMSSSGAGPPAPGGEKGCGLKRREGAREDHQLSDTWMEDGATTLLTSDPVIGLHGNGLRDLNDRRVVTQSCIHGSWRVSLSVWTDGTCSKSNQWMARDLRRAWMGRVRRDAREGRRGRAWIASVCIRSSVYRVHADVCVSRDAYGPAVCCMPRLQSLRAWLQSARGWTISRGARQHSTQHGSVVVCMHGLLRVRFTAMLCVVCCVHSHCIVDLEDVCVSLHPACHDTQTAVARHSRHSIAVAHSLCLHPCAKHDLAVGGLIQGECFLGRILGECAGGPQEE